MARGKRPVTFRTRKLSLSAPMVLPWRRGGRVGRRRTNIPERAPAFVPGPFRRPHPPTSAAGAGFLRRRADVVREPGVQRPHLTPRATDLVEGTPLVQPVRWLPVPADVQRLVLEQLDPVGV